MLCNQTVTLLLKDSQHAKLYSSSAARHAISLLSMLQAHILQLTPHQPCHWCNLLSI